MIGEVFHFILYQPIINLLIVIYLLLPVHDFGVAIATLTVLIRGALSPFTKKALHSQRKLQDLQPKLQELRKKHAKNPQEATRAMMALYKEHGINPFGGFLPILVQLPVLFALFYALRAIVGDPTAAFAKELYPIVPHPTAFSELSFGGLLNLSQKSMVLAIFAGLAQFMQSRLSFQKNTKLNTQKKGDFSHAMSVQMQYVFPVFLAVITASLPAGIALYIVVTTLFSVWQQHRLNKQFANTDTN